jgi:DNA-binding NtrC family response regulator
VSKGPFATRKEPGIENNSTLINILSVSTTEDDHTLLENTFSNQVMLETNAGRESKWLLYRSATLRSALAVLRENQISVVLCDGDVAGTWRELLEQITLLDNPPSLIVTSRLADDNLWAEALHLGAYDVLAKPFARNELVQSLKSAWLHWAGSETQSE